MTNKRELELLAEWLGIEYEFGSGGIICIPAGANLQREWNPSPTGNSDDFLNMAAGRVMFRPTYLGVTAYYFDGIATRAHLVHGELYENHNNDKLAAMKHAAYQVCLMAAREELR